MNKSEPWIDCHTHVGVDQWFYLNGHFPYAIDYRSLVEQSARNGFQRVLVFPCVSYFGWEGLKMSAPSVGVDDFSIPYAFENRRMLSEIFDLNPDYAAAAIPFAIVDPGRKQVAQVGNLRKLRERYPIRGLKIQATVIEVPIRSLLAEGKELLELAREWDIPVLIHSSISPKDPWSQTSDILDIAQAWPAVRFCLAHSCRFDLPSLRRALTLPNAWVDCSAHCIHCDAAVADFDVVAAPSRRLETDYSRPERVLKDLCDLLPDRLMWGSDAPFYSYGATHEGKQLSLVSSYEKEVAALSLLSDRQRSAMLRDNTLRFLGEVKSPA